MGGLNTYESTDAIAREFGLVVLDLMTKCMGAVYKWREESNPNEKTDMLVNALGPLLEAFCCQWYKSADKWRRLLIPTGSVI